MRARAAATSLTTLARHCGCGLTGHPRLPHLGAMPHQTFEAPQAAMLKHCVRYGSGSSFFGLAQQGAACYVDALATPPTPPRGASPHLLRNAPRQAPRNAAASPKAYTVARYPCTKGCCTPASTYCSLPSQPTGLSPLLPPSHATSARKGCCDPPAPLPLRRAAFLARLPACLPTPAHRCRYFLRCGGLRSCSRATSVAAAFRFFRGCASLPAYQRGVHLPTCMLACQPA